MSKEISAHSQIRQVNKQSNNLINLLTIMAQEGVYVFPDANSGRGSNIGDYATIAALSNNGGFGGMNNPFWMFLMYPFILPFLNGMYGGGFGGYGGYGNNLLGTGFLSNQINNNNDKETILNALRYNSDAIAQLANNNNMSISQVRSAVDIANSKLAELGSQVGMTGMQVINAVQNGDATLGRQLCECCCENRLAIANQTATLQADSARNFAATQLQMAQNEAADQLGMCQQTNTLSTQAANNTNSILGAIQAQNTMITKEFCDLKERELQNKINTQGDIITQLRNQISNDHQTLQFNAAFHALDDKIDGIAAKQPNTVPVVWPNLTAVNNTPYAGGFGYSYGLGNGFGGLVL